MCRCNTTPFLSRVLLFFAHKIDHRSFLQHFTGERESVSFFFVTTHNVMQFNFIQRIEKTKTWFIWKSRISRVNILAAAADANRLILQLQRHRKRDKKGQRGKAPMTKPIRKAKFHVCVCVRPSNKLKHHFTTIHFLPAHTNSEITFGIRIEINKKRNNNQTEQMDEERKKQRKKNYGIFDVNCSEHLYVRCK